MFRGVPRLEQNPPFDADSKLGAKNKYATWKRTIGVYVFVALPTIRSKKSPTGFKRAQILRP